MQNTLICLPTYNESESVGAMIDGVLALGLPLIISDAGSNDGTVEIARSKGVEVLDRKEMGYGTDYGSGIMLAIKVANDRDFQNLVFLDCDMSYPVNKIPDLISMLPKYELVTGARDFSRISFFHRLANILFTRLTNLLFSTRFKDVCSGMRAIRIDPFLGRLHARDMSFVIQMSIYAAKNKLAIIDVPVEYFDRLGTSKVTILDAFPIFFQILKQRFVKG